jgi:2-polyprenyl-6-methoxyphenol hydroxylase-like FAD-dependent oxidoreductase
VLDTILLRHAGDLGTDVFESTTVEDISLNGHIAVQTRCGGSRNQLNCTFLVGADGRNSLVAKKANPGRSKGYTYQHDGRIGLQWYAPYQPGLKSDLRLYLLPFGYFGIVHVDEKTANLAMVLDTRRSGPIRKELPTLIEAMRAVNPTVHRDLGDLTPISEVQTTSPITPWSRRHSKSNVHLIGDAGRTVEPFTGEGILFALIDGIGTGEELAARLHGRRIDALDRPSRFWVNRVFSPLLRHPRLANAAVALGAAYPPLTRLASRVVIPA